MCGGVDTGGNKVLTGKNTEWELQGEAAQSAVSDA